MGVENLAPTRIWSPDRPARSELLYRLHYRDPQFTYYVQLLKAEALYVHIPALSGIVNAALSVETGS